MFSLYFSVVRQAISIGLFYLFMIDFDRKKYIRAFILVGIAVGVQYTSIIYFLLYFLSCNKYTYKYRIILWGVSIFFLISYFIGYDVSRTLLSKAPTFGIGTIEKKDIQC